MQLQAESLPSYLERVCSTTSNGNKDNNNNNKVNDEAIQELKESLLAAADACAMIATELSRLPLTEASIGARAGQTNVQGEEQKGMDVVSNEIFCDRLRPVVAALASEEEEAVVYGSGRHYEIAFDPLDGSSNLDISVPTGTIFGIAPHNAEAPFSTSGRHLVAAGYTVYSSSTELVISLGDEAVGFTLDPSLLSSTTSSSTTPFPNADAFLLSRPEIQCPTFGPYYSLNEAREPDWPDGLRRWIHDAKLGQTASGAKYSSRYVCSLCADVHRTLLKGGWAGNPRPHLRLLYEAAPLAFVTEAAGGRGSDGVRELLDIVPTGLHDRVCVFLGGKGDVGDLVEGYGNVQQGAQTYKA